MSNYSNKQLLILCFISFIVTGSGGFVHADESPFGYLYTTNSPPQGEWEYEQWNTVRTGKATGSYTSLDLANEIEHGFTDNLSGAFYIKSSFLHAHNVPDPDNTAVNLDNQSSFDVNGVSIELKDRLFDPAKSPIGLMLYVEPELGVRDPLSGSDTAERGAEFKLILDKHVLADRLIVASNVMFEPEWERQDGARSKELKNEYSIGAAYRWRAGWKGGLELVNRRTFDDQDFAKQKASAWFLGPSLHYDDHEWWATFTVLPQLTSEYGEYEKMEIRLRFGLDFD